MKKFSIKTLGCKVNQYEEQAIRENLIKYGFTEADPKEADIFILNSCTVTNEADRKSVKLMRKIKKENPSIKVFVTGCYAVLEKDIERLEAMPEVDVVINGKVKKDVPKIIAASFDAFDDKLCVKEEISSFSGHTRSFLKIQDGCDQKCSYCKVNIVRGPSRSRKEEEIINEVERLISSGHKEIVLTGICIGSWRGEGGKKLSDLLGVIDKIDKDFRVRISSIEPNHIDQELIEVMSRLNKICQHLHIPLQSGSSRMLKLMGRRYTQEDFENLVMKIRSKMPLAGITIDVIIGFPGEEEEDFTNTVDFLENIKPSRMHVFKYSDREGTVSFENENKVPVYAARRRVEKIIQMGEDFQKVFCKSFVDKEVKLLIEKIDDNIAEGYTAEYLRVKVDASRARKGDIISAKVTSVDKNSPCLIGKAS